MADNRETSVRPYERFDNFVQQCAQLQIASKENGAEISSCETVYPEFPDIILGAPVNKHVPLATPLLNQLSRYFGVLRREQSVPIERDSLIRYDQMCMTNGDNIRTASIVDDSPMARDNSYIKFNLFSDANAAHCNWGEVLFREVRYGLLLDIFHLFLTEDDGSRNRYLLARVQLFKTGGLDAALPENPVVTFNMTQSMRGSPIIIHAGAIVAAVGIVHLDGPLWAIVDRSWGRVHAEFVDEDGNVEHDE
ncbi:hypothetical protein FRC08_000806 [Ceratobasidium sp. 394]|nr:hypothetical protein FRC08_000806 [Ceratobasidium sp. 394]